MGILEVRSLCSSSQLQIPIMYIFGLNDSNGCLAVDTTVTCPNGQILCCHSHSLIHVFHPLIVWLQVKELARNSKNNL